MNASDEARHEPGGPGWLERWTFEAWDKDATFGAIAAIHARPCRAACVVLGVGGARRPPAATLVDTELHIPKSSLALRGPALWADHVCETPLEHWTVANEAYGVALDDRRRHSARSAATSCASASTWSGRRPRIRRAGRRIHHRRDRERGDPDRRRDARHRSRRTVAPRVGRARWPGVAAYPPQGPRAPLRIDPPSGGVVLVERGLTPDGWDEWLRPERAP